MIRFFKNILKIFTSRIFIIFLLLAIQLSLFIYLDIVLWQLGKVTFIAFSVLSTITAITIVNRNMNPAYKIGWMLIVLVLPFAGSIFYLTLGRAPLSSRNKKKFDRLKADIELEFKKNQHSLTIENADVTKTINYIKNTTSFPAWNNTDTKLLTPGEEFFDELIKELKKATKYIFFEYFIIQKGFMWNSIVDILESKVKEGVDVRLIYDDYGLMTKVSATFRKELTEKGIKVLAFNPFIPNLSRGINYRDHRKITVIDGNVGFVGGNNLADEYINKVVKFGHWKDASLVLKGAGVWNLTFLFLQMWQLSTKDRFNYEEYYPTLTNIKAEGVVQIFGDGPHDSHQSIEMVFMQIINNAKKYVYIATPYLIIDHEMEVALKLAANSGIDVRIIVPGIPDKKLVFMVTQSYYAELIKAGVKIYEYKPGFIHSKYIVADDEVAMIGTANMDYRSFYLHFEVSCYLYQTDSVIEIRDDALKCIKESKQITYSEIKKVGFFKRILVSILRLFAPLA